MHQNIFGYRKYDSLTGVLLGYWLYCARVSCGAVYCNRSCLWVCVWV